MSSEKNNGGSSLLQSIVSGIVIASLAGIGAAELKNSDKLSDIRAAMMPREEVELRLHQLSVELRALEATFQQEKRTLEIAIKELEHDVKSTVRSGRP